LPLEKAIEVACEKAGLGYLTGSDLKVQTREIIGTCVSMRVKVDGHWAVEALEIISKGEWDDRFN
jgi:ribosomal protein L11